MAPQDGEPVVEKDRCSAFHGTTLDQQLRSAASPASASPACRPNIASTPIAGDAHGLGYEVVLVKDGHTTYDTLVISAAQIVAHHNRTLNAARMLLEALDLRRIKAIAAGVG